MQMTVYSAQLFLSGMVFVLLHAFCVIYGIYNYAQLASFERFRLSCMRKKAGIL